MLKVVWKSSLGFSTNVCSSIVLYICHNNYVGDAHCSLLDIRIVTSQESGSSKIL